MNPFKATLAARRATFVALGTDVGLLSQGAAQLAPHFKTNCPA